MDRTRLTAAVRPLADRCWHGHCWVKTPDGPRRVDQQFTEVQLSEHVTGARAYGLCPIAPGTSTTRAACLDLDSHKGATSWQQMTDTAQLLCEALQEDGYMPTAFRSSGGAGVHIYLVWDAPQDAYSVRRMLTGTLALCGLASGTGGVFKQQVEVFPKQDEVPADGYGSMFILPLAGKSQSASLTLPGAVSAWTPSRDVPVLARPERVAPAHTDLPELARLKSALDAIPNTGENELEYDQWRNVVFGVHHATDGADGGLSLAHDFSARSSKYDPDFLDNRVWPYARADRDGPAITVRSVFALAEQHGWQDPAVADDFDVEEVQPASADRAVKGARFAPIPAHLFAGGKPPSWIVKGVLPQAELAVVFGESGSGKSFFTLDMAMAIARGLPWREHRVRQGAVVYIAAEGASGVRNRLKAYAEHTETALQDVPLSVIPSAPNFLLKEDIIELVNAVRPLKPAVVIVDTLSRVLAGGDENSGEDMGLAVKHCSTIHAVTGALVVLIHHSGKDSSKGARGWSGLRAAVDTEIEILRSDADRVAVVTKQKDGSDEEVEFGFKLAPVAVGEDEDGDAIVSCVLEHGAAPSKDRRKREPKGAKEKVVLRTVQEMVTLGGDSPKVSEVIDAAVAQLPFDAAEGKRDTRRQHVLRAIESLQERGSVRIENGEVLLAGGK